MTRRGPSPAPVTVLKTRDEPEDGAGHRGLATAARRGARVGTLSSLAQQVLSVVATAILARILTPTEFGVAAAANSAAILVTTFTQLGFGQRLIVKRELSRSMISTTYWFALGVGISAGGLLALLALPLAHFVGVPEAASLVILLGPVVALKVTGSVPRALMLRDLRFKSVYGVDLSWTFVYCATEIVLASRGFGARAIPLGLLAGAVVYFVLYSLVSRVLPTLAFSWAELRADLPMQATVQGNAFAITAVKNADYWLVGQILGPASLGVYYVSYVLPSILRQRLTWVTSQVLMPVYAKLRGDRDRLASGYLRSLRLHVTVGGATMVGVAVVADPLIRLSFGSAWAGAVSPLRILAIAAAIDFISAATFPLFLGSGTPGRNLTTQLVRLASLVTLSPLVLLMPSLTTMAWVVLGSALCGAVVTQVLAARLLSHPVRRQLQAIATPVMASAGMAVAGLGLTRAGLDRLPAFAEIVCIGTGSIVGFLIAYLIAGGARARGELHELWRLVDSRSDRRRVPTQ